MPGVIRLQVALWVIYTSLALSVLGCAAGSSAPAPSAPDRNSLDGNWLLAGQLPFISLLQPANQSFGLGMTLSVVSGQIVGGGTDQFPCGKFVTGGSGDVVTGTVAQDGSFSAQSPSTQPSDVPTLQIHGTVPSSGGSSWTGSYTYANNNSSCPFTSSGPLTAVRIADITGTYAGSASLSVAPGPPTSPSQPISLTLTLQQGQPSADGKSTNETILAGSVKVQGSSCFTSGQIAQTPVQVNGSVEGTHAAAAFTMDDGSQLLFLVNIEDIESSKLGVISLLVSGGKCEGQTAGSFELSRQ